MGAVFLGKHWFWSLPFAKISHLCLVWIHIFHVLREHMFPQILFTWFPFWFSISSLLLLFLPFFFITGDKAEHLSLWLRGICLIPAYCLEKWLSKYGKSFLQLECYHTWDLFIASEFWCGIMSWRGTDQLEGSLEIQKSILTIGPAPCSSPNLIKTQFGCSCANKRKQDQPFLSFQCR